MPPATTSRCQIATVPSVYLMPLPPGPDPLGEKRPSGDDESLANSNCMERLREFQLKMHREGGGHLPKVSTTPVHNFCHPGLTQKDLNMVLTHMGNLTRYFVHAFLCFV